MALSRATVMGYHSALHDSDNVQHADPDCPAAAIILLQLLPSAERPSYAVCAGGGLGAHRRPPPGAGSCPYSRQPGPQGMTRQPTVWSSRARQATPAHAWWVATDRSPNVEDARTRT